MPELLCVSLVKLGILYISRFPQEHLALSQAIVILPADPRAFAADGEVRDELGPDDALSPGLDADQSPAPGDRLHGRLDASVPVAIAAPPVRRALFGQRFLFAQGRVHGRPGAR